MNHSLQSSELVPDDFNLFETMKVHLGQTFQSDDELQQKWNGYAVKIKHFMLLEPVTCQKKKERKKLSVVVYEFWILFR